jgi:DNA-binding NtrC family response regulator
VLQEGEFEPVGSSRTVRVDVRIIAATNRAPEEAVAEGKLREDLLYRLQVFPLHLPPLRERDGDVKLIAEEFLKDLNQKEGTAKVFAADAHATLADWHWPGNVRELRNVVQRAYIMADESINAGSLPLETGKARQASSSGPFLQIRVGSTVAEVERILTLATLQQCGGVKEKAAQTLGVSLKTLYNRLREYEARGDTSPADAE